ncbi:MAG: hypothetical protein H0U99_05960 [Chthoniobacterales bacterium]|nr:hypothetical protein [Chthoniobacterales bacterium]
MPELGAANLLGGLVFGSVGFIAFVYGKRLQRWTPMFIGFALMAYPYFIADTLIMFGIGAALTASLFCFRQ